MSPTVFNIYTHDLPDPIAYSEHIIYADDISQIIALPGSVTYLTKQVPRAIESIYNFENKLKIKTNQSKFQLITIDRIKPPDIPVSNQLIKHCSDGKVLGLSFTSRGVTKHITNRTQLAKLLLNKPYRFKNLSSKNKRKFTSSQLVQNCYIQLFHYPPAAYPG